MNFLGIYIVLLFLISLACLRPKSISIHVILLFTVFSFFALSFDDADRLIYQREYDSITSTVDSSYEILYVGLMKFGKSLGFDFQGYRCFQAILVIVLIDTVVLKYSKAPNVVWAFYLIYSALFDATLMRHIVAMALALHGVMCLMNAQKWKDDILTTAFFVTCGLLHSSYWIMLLFIPFKWFFQSHKLIALLLVAGGYAVAIMYKDMIFSFYALFAIREATLEKYMTGNYANMTGAAYDLVKYLFIISPVFIFRGRQSVYELNSNNEKYHRIASLNSNILAINLIFCIILIPQFFAVNYSRLFRILVLINYIYMSNIYIVSIKRRDYKVLLYLSIYSLVLLLLLLFWESEATISEVWNMHFETNLIFSAL